MNLSSSGGSLPAGRLCRCRKSDAPHVHRWQAACPICGFVVLCNGVQICEIPNHMIELEDGADADDADDDGEPIVEDARTTRARYVVPAKRPCTGAGFRLTAKLGVHEVDR